MCGTFLKLKPHGPSAVLFLTVQSILPSHGNPSSLTPPLTMMPLRPRLFLQCHTPHQHLPNPLLHRHTPLLHLSPQPPVQHRPRSLMKARGVRCTLPSPQAHLFYLSVPLCSRPLSHRCWWGTTPLPPASPLPRGLGGSYSSMPSFSSNPLYFICPPFSLHSPFSPVSALLPSQ